MGRKNKRGPGKQRIYTLTQADVERTLALLSTARDAVSELFDFRRVDPVDPYADFPFENSVYEQSSTIFRDTDCHKEIPF